MNQAPFTCSNTVSESGTQSLPSAADVLVTALDKTVTTTKYDRATGWGIQGRDDRTSFPEGATFVLRVNRGKCQPSEE